MLAYVHDADIQIGEGPQPPRRRQATNCPRYALEGRVAVVSQESLTGVHQIGFRHADP